MFDIHRRLYQSSVWLRFFQNLAISSSIHLLQYVSLNSFLSAITPTLLHSNLAQAVQRFFCTSKFFTLILQIIPLTSGTVLLTFKASTTLSEGIRSLLSFYLFCEYHQFELTHQFLPYLHRVVLLWFCLVLVLFLNWVIFNHYCSSFLKGHYLLRQNLYFNDWQLFSL